MPLAKLEILKGHSMEHKAALFGCVRDGLTLFLEKRLTQSSRLMDNK